ncbi:MAG: DUF3226 domain-containing protein [Pirellulales bacterium]
MHKRVHQRVLLVEGEDDKRVIPEIVEANGLTWGETAAEAIVFIKPIGGIDKLTEPGTISAEAKASGLQTLGVVIDANDSAEQRFQSLRSACLESFPNLPDSLPIDGLIHDTNGLRLGIWLMPDNQSRGMLETFLAYLAGGDESDPLFEHAKRACDQAKQIGAPFSDAHAGKSHIHCWLAWQKEPGRQLHDAVKFSYLDATSRRAQPFIQWFRKLYEL